MASLVVDDVTLALGVCIILTFALSLHVSHLYTPSIHPLILARQADVSPTHRARQSPVYRNVNAPAGFELAARPSRDVSDVPSLLAAAARSREAQTDKATGETRCLYGHAASLTQVQADVAALAAGVRHTLGEGAATLALCVAHDSYDALLTLLSPCTGGIELFVAAPAARQPPGTAIRAVVTDLASLDAALQLPLAADALLILPSASDADEARSRSAFRALVFSDILAQGASSPQPAEGISIAASSLYAHYASSGAWVAISHAQLVAGVTAHLAFYAADAVPASHDVLFVERCAALSACAAPNGLALALAALYTGAGIVEGALTEGGISRELREANATLLYLSTPAASSFSSSLSSLSSSFLTPLARHLKLASLRAGVLSSRGLPESLVFSSARRRAGLTHVRAAMLVGSGEASQGVLDALRINLGCAVMHAFLPASLGGAAATAPVAASHALDLQAFNAPSVNGRAVPAHVGPPAVSVELKLVQSRAAREKGYERLQGMGTEEDPCGEIYVRGTSICSSADAADGALGDASTEERWTPTGAMGALRTNGTLVVLLPAAASHGEARVK